MPRLMQLLSHESKVLRKEAAWTISNVTAGTVDQASCMHSFLAPGFSLCLVLSFFSVARMRHKETHRNRVVQEYVTRMRHNFLPLITAHRLST